MRGLWFILVAIPFISNANSRVELSGAYTREDSIALMEAFDKAMTAVDMLNREIEEIASLPSSERETAWNRSAHLGYWHMYITVVQLASPAIHNKDNSHIF